MIETISPVRVIARKRPFSSDLVERSFEPGVTLNTILSGCGLDPDVVPARVCIDGDVIEDAYWETTVPAAGQLVTVRVVPQGGNNQSKDILRIVAMVGVLALAIVAPYAAGALGMTFLSAGMGAAFLTAGIGLAGSLLVSALIPPQQQNLPKLSGQSVDTSPSLSISGGRNELRLYRPVQRVYGRMRFTPPLGAEPYTEVVGNEQYLRMLFCVGYGPLFIPESEFRIGDTPLSQFDGVTYEVRQGYDDDAPLTLFTNDIHEEALSLSLNQSDGYQQRTSGVDADELSIDVTLPNGAYRVKDDGTLVSIDASWFVEYRKVGDITWILEGAVQINAYTPRTVMRWRLASYPTPYRGALGYYEQYAAVVYDEIPGTAKTIRLGRSWKPITGRGQYEVRLRKTTLDQNNPRIVEQAYWTVLRTIKAQTPVKLKGMALVAMRIKATDQLNGVVDQFSLVAQSILTTWNGNSWVMMATSNPASIFRNVLQGSATPNPLPDNRLDFETIQEWSVDNDLHGRSCGLIVDYQTTVAEILDTVAATGRASRRERDGKYSVVLDKPQGEIVQMFTPRNSWGFKGRKVFAELPHALKIGFVNEENDWLQDERYVYADGYNADGTNGLTAASRFESLDLFGVTRPKQIYEDGRYHIAAATLRPETYELMSDFEHLVCTRGSLVGVVHDVALWGLGQGRVVAIVANTLGKVIAVTMDDPLVMDEESRYVVRMRLMNGTTILKEIQSVAGEQWTLNFLDPLEIAEAPSIGTLVAYGELNREVVRLIVKSIQPKGDYDALLTFVDEAPGVHTAADGPIPPHDPQITIPVQQRKPKPPVIDAILSDESVLMRDMDGSFRTRIIIKLHYISGGMPAKRVEVRYRRSETVDSWLQTATPASGDADELEIPQVIEKTFYDLLIRTVSQYEVFSDPILISNYLAVGRTTPPPDVTTVILQERRLRWSYPNPPRDFDGFAVRMHYGARPYWDDAIPIHEGLIPVSYMDLDRATGTRTYLVKAVDTANYESESPGFLVIDWGNRLVGNAVEEVDYALLAFPGIIEGGSAVLGQLEADADVPFWTNNLDPIWTGDSAPFWGTSFARLTYTFTYTPPLALVVGSMFVSADVQGTYTIEYRTDSQRPFWTNDADPFWTGDSNPMWSAKGDWLPWPGQLTGLIHQQYEFRIVVNPGFTQGKIFSVYVNVDMPDVTEKVLEMVVGSSGTRVPITKDYLKVTGVRTTLLDDGGNARYVIVADKDPVGPLLRAYDNTGALTTALVDVELEGY